MEEYETIMSNEGWIGKHLLTEVIRGEIETENFWEEIIKSDFLAFCLDGKYWLGVEDPDDGWRSMLEGLYHYDSWKALQERVPGIIHNEFAPVQVIGKEINDIKILIDKKNGEEILTCGTDYSEEYYPCCIMGWYPERMATNKNGGK